MKALKKLISDCCHARVVDGQNNKILFGYEYYKCSKCNCECSFVEFEKKKKKKIKKINFCLKDTA